MTVLIRGARQLLTLNGPSAPRRGASLSNLGLIQDGAILIVDGIISAVGPTRRVENLAEAKGAIDINASGHVVMPAFVDCHAHLMGGSGLVDLRDSEPLAPETYDFDLPRRTVVASGQIRTTPAKTIEHRTELLLEECLRHGTTTMEAKSGYALDENSEIKLLRVIRNLDEKVAMVPTFFVPQALGFLSSSEGAEWFDNLISSVIPAVGVRKLARFIDVDCSGPGRPAFESKRILQAGRAVGMRAKLHTSGADPQTLDMGLQAGAVSIEGLARAAEAEADLLAQANVMGTLMPADAVRGTDDRVAPARMLIDRGVPVALASGLHHGRTSTYNMQSILSLACSQAKMTTAEAISAATINAAHVAGEATRVGSLQFGKDADLLILATSDYREVSYYFGVNQVKLTMKKGRVVYRDPGFIV